MTHTNVINDSLLRTLAKATGPAIMFALTRTSARDGATALEHQKGVALQKLRHELTKLYPEQADTLLAPFENMTPSPNGSTVIALRSPDLYEEVVTTADVKELAVAGDMFDLLRLLPFKDHDREFYILAVSLNRSRLIHCTGSAAREVELPDGTPRSLAESMQTDVPDHLLEGRSASGPSTGHMKGVVFGTSSDSERRPENLLHFFAQLDRGVRTLLRDSEAPLVAAAVDAELADYRRVNTYPHFVEPGVIGAPDGLKGGELHRRALELVNRWLPEQVEKQIENFDKLVGTAHASTALGAIVEAARQGRISHLFLSAGVLSGESLKDANLPDHLNETIVWTYRDSGTAYILPPDRMPGGAAVAAVFRYPDPMIQLPKPEEAGART